MTRFEALGILPDKKITCLYIPNGSKEMRQAWKTDFVTFVNQLPPSATFKLIHNDNNPKLGWLIKFHFLNPRTQRFNSAYLKPDKRKLKRFAKRFDISLTPRSKPETCPETSE